MGHLLGLTDAEMLGPPLSDTSIAHLGIFFTQGWDAVRTIQIIGVKLKKQNPSTWGLESF